MATYSVSSQQSKDNFVFLRVMFYIPKLPNFRELQNQFFSNTDMFFYLIFKYHNRFNELIALKNSSKKKYQEITCNYTNIGIRVSSGVHQILKDLSDVTGYSISALVGFLIEWELSSDHGAEVLKNSPTVESNFAASFESEIVITEVWINHRYQIINEIVEEDFIWRYG
ncbi:MAG: hypothetical protein ACK4UJ_03500 [Leptonema sp. (in: bacteria)]